MDNMNKQSRPSITDEWGSFIAVPSSFVKASKPLTDKARWLFVLLREYTNGESGVAFPSYDTIRERTGWGRSQISNAIKCLEKHGWLSRQHQFGGVTQYRLVKPVEPIEPNSTVLKLLETPQTSITKNPKPRRQKSQTGTSIVPIRDAIKIESTKIEFNKIDICESQVEPFDSLANSPSQLQVIQNGQKDSGELSVTSESPTVHANGGIATPPEVAATPPSAQAAVITPSQNGQLRVCSPLADLAGIMASVEAVDPPSTPVSVKSAKGSRKPMTGKTDSPEEVQRKTDHKTLMDTLHTRTGQPILNGGAQAAAVKRILGAYTVEQAIEVLDSQLAGNWRGPVSWLSVQTQIADYFRRKEQQTKLGGNNNGNYKSGSILQRLCNRRALGDFG